jgi:DNA invertase Pin-like site-specific DNA recombinase
MSWEIRGFLRISVDATGLNEKSSKNGRTKAVAYLRTSSAANVGADKDSEKRQRQAITAYAKSARFEIAAEDWFYDPAVSGADPIETRPGFNKLLDRIEGNGVRVVIIEDASRFARDLMTQELGILSLIKLGVRVITATGDDLTDTSDPIKKAMRQIAALSPNSTRPRLVSKLRRACERKREKGERLSIDGRAICEGRKNLREIGVIAESSRKSTLRVLRAASSWCLPSGLRAAPSQGA